MQNGIKKTWIYNGQIIIEDEVYSIVTPEKGFTCFDFCDQLYMLPFNEMNLHSILYHLAGTIPEYFASRETINRIINDLNFMIQNKTNYMDNFYKQDFNSFKATLASIIKYKIHEHFRLIELNGNYSYFRQRGVGELSEEAKRVYNEGKKEHNDSVKKTIGAQPNVNE